MNDRELRNVITGLGGTLHGVPKESGFIITVASEVMAILCLASDINDLKKRLGDILIAYTYENLPIYAKDLKVNGAMAVLLKEAVKPNLVQSLEGSPVIIHGGPFANIAHGCNSVIATNLGLKLSDYCITEAGFGSDLGAEKFFDIKCRTSGLNPSAVVLVVTIRALKYHGGCAIDKLTEKNLEYLKFGISNLKVHIENIKKFGVPIAAALNKFSTDTPEEINFVKNYCNEMSVEFEISEAFEKGGNGCLELAKKVCNLCKKDTNFKTIYSLNLSIKEKIFSLASEIYRAKEVVYSRQAEENIKRIENLEKNDLPICVAKTQYSISDDPKKLGSPSGYSFNVNKVSLSNGAGFIVAYAGDIMTMPGLPKKPAAKNIDIDGNNKISGLF
jgi:formate--tetrahydrofolate ligase